MSGSSLDMQLTLYCRKKYLIQLVQLILKYNLDWESGLFGACEGGYLDLVMLMIKYGATNWSDGLEGACYGEHPDLFNLMIKHGAIDCNCCGKDASEHQL